MKKYETVIIGGGAAGICAAISAARAGRSVVICEKMPQPGRKILASGDGRCNLLNDNLRPEYYNPEARGLVAMVFNKFGKKEILDFFTVLGLRTYSREGRIFPVANQASSVLKVLEMELQRLSVPVELNFNCAGISFSPDGITVSSTAGGEIACRKVIITGGGKTYPAFGSDGSIYEAALALGHTIIEPAPCAVPLVVKDNLCFLLQGQRIPARVRSVIDSKAGEPVPGELLFTKYGLSGTCILDVSEEISLALHRQHKSDISLAVDMVPFMKKEELQDILSRRRKEKVAPEDMLAGILPNKFGPALKDILEENDTDAIIASLKERRFNVNGTRGWNEAEFTGGGVNINEVNPETLESRLKKNVYFAGEVLDVNGKRGGYNLAWAWASGWVAGSADSSPPAAGSE